ncbi:MAG: transposase [Colwellia sp.]
MSKNQVQHQKGYNLLELFNDYGAQEQYVKALFNRKRSSGFFCSECGSASYCTLKSRNINQCNGCHQQTSFTSRNILFLKEVSRRTKKHLSAGSVVFSDGLACFKAVKYAQCEHFSIITAGGSESVKKEQFIRANIMIRNVKNSILGTYHAIRHKHLPRYLAEFSYRFNRRFELAGMLARFAYIALRTPSMPIKLLSQAELYGSQVKN